MRSAVSSDLDEHHEHAAHPHQVIADREQGTVCAPAAASHVRARDPPAPRRTREYISRAARLWMVDQRRREATMSLPTLAARAGGHGSRALPDPAKAATTFFRG